jgi:hypothetical protein
MGIWSSLKRDIRRMRSRLPPAKQLRALRDDHAALQGRLAEIAAKVTDVRDLSLNVNHHAIEADRTVQSVHEHLLSANHFIMLTHARLDSLTAQVSAEREATMASNDGLRRQVAFVADCLGDDLLRKRAGPVLENIRDQLDRAESMVQVARSQYRDTMPGDANSFAPVEP